MDALSDDLDDGAPVAVLRDVLIRMTEHLYAAYPFEGCGILIGTKNPDGGISILQAAGTRNSETERGVDRYAIDPRDFQSTQLFIDKSKGRNSFDLQIVGFFHSHPDSPAKPSSYDLEMAVGLLDVTQEFYIYAIISINNGEPDDARFWRLSEYSLKFVEVNAEHFG